MFPLGIQLLLLLATLLALLLAAYAIYVRISQHRYTEKRFNFVALWSCIGVTSLGLLHIANIPPWMLLLSYFNIPIAPPSISAQVLACIIVLFFIHKIATWARHWNGLYSEMG